MQTKICDIIPKGLRLNSNCLRNARWDLRYFPQILLHSLEHMNYTNVTVCVMTYSYIWHKCNSTSELFARVYDIYKCNSMRHDIYFYIWYKCNSMCEVFAGGPWLSTNTHVASHHHQLQVIFTRFMRFMNSADIPRNPLFHITKHFASLKNPVVQIHCS